MDSSIQESEWGKRNNMLEEKDFELLDESSNNANEVVDDEPITKDDFVLTQVDSTVHEQKFQTKPTTFLKDSLKRFSKNKSSVVAAYILGALLILSFAVPAFNKSDTKHPKPHKHSSLQNYLKREQASGMAPQNTPTSLLISVVNQMPKQKKKNKNTGGHQVTNSHKEALSAKRNSPKKNTAMIFLHSVLSVKKAMSNSVTMKTVKKVTMLNSLLKPSLL